MVLAYIYIYNLKDNKIKIDLKKRIYKRDICIDNNQIQFLYTIYSSMLKLKQTGYSNRLDCFTLSTYLISVSNTRKSLFLEKKSLYNQFYY